MIPLSDTIYAFCNIAVYPLYFLYLESVTSDNSKTFRFCKRVALLPAVVCSMAIGMTYEQYWDGDNEAPVMFRELWKRKAELRDREFWEIGRYTNLAVADVVSRMTDSEKNIIPYPEMPLMEKQEEERKAEAKEQEKLAAQAWMNDLVRLYADVPKDSA